MPPPKGQRETPRQSFERLRQAFDVIKEKHSDPWNWHEYLGDEPKDPEETTDTEVLSLQPNKRSNVDRVKAHLLATIAELNRGAAAADMAYFQMCVTPEDVKECCRVLGSSGDIDEELLLESGDASPAKIMALLQKKLDKAKARIVELEQEILALQETLAEDRAVSEDRWRKWQSTSMTLEEALTRLNWTTIAFEQSMERERQLQEGYNDVHIRMVRASRLMLFKGRELLRDKLFKANPRENLFYAYHGFMFILQKEKDERKRAEELERRDAVEFGLRNEVRFLLFQNARTRDAVMRLTLEVGRLKLDRRELGCRIIYKHRPYEDREYFLWIWELWVPLRPRLVLEKLLDREQASHAAVVQLLAHTSSQLPPAAKTIDKLRRTVAEALTARDIARREITAQSARQYARLIEGLVDHRGHEMTVLARLHFLDVEAKKERIAVLEREIAEDTHIQALKAMVVDLESRLRRALDRRKQRAFVVPPGGGPKCAQCGRENMFRNWKALATTDGDPEASPRESGSDEEAPPPTSPPPGSTATQLAGVELEPLSDPRNLLGSRQTSMPELRASKSLGLMASRDKRPSYMAVWRPV
eukprot:TRINITY_DN48580_c0_g1_i1.p1 TRINITY_DN48580_c0_g1~~TRINITY_DN48580_c0_g1_i1.p1  ORF type:complete len:617 (-),score=137.10 TRINITY_DN48580_c0_g1_i1:57-1820(-)